MIISKNNYSIKPFRNSKVIHTGQYLNNGKPNRQAERLNHLRHTLTNDMITGRYLEFGVFEGRTLNYTAELKPHDIIHGFDSFEGLPEHWDMGSKKTKYVAGYFATKIPVVRSNVKLWVGWFDQQIPEYLKACPNDPIAYLHIDGDLYSSAWTVLTMLNHLIVPGTIILFDEFCKFGHFSKPYKTWKNDEYKALKDWIWQYNRQFEILHRNECQQCAIRITQ